MKVKATKPKGARMFKSRNHRNRLGIRCKRPLFIEPRGTDWWFNLETGQWNEGYIPSARQTSSYYAMSHDGFKDVYSLKAALRLIRKWDVPEGTEFYVSLPFMGHDFHVTK